MVYLIVPLFFSFPLIVSGVYEAIFCRKSWCIQLSITRILASYGIYSIAIAGSATSDFVDLYMANNCIWDGIGEPPCSSAMYMAASFSEEWLFLCLLVLAVFMQLLYLHSFSKRLTFALN